MQRFALSVVALVLMAACKNSSPTPSSATPPNGDGSAQSASGAVPDTWNDAADIDTQVAYMKSRVVPAMQPKFAGDPEKSAEFGCATCHGPANQSPHDFLPHLTLDNGQIAEFNSMPEVSKYMAETIVPAMASAMGEEPFDPATGQGFGCGGCHAIDPG